LQKASSDRSDDRAHAEDSHSRRRGAATGALAIAALVAVTAAIVAALVAITAELALVAITILVVAILALISTLEAAVLVVAPFLARRAFGTTFARLAEILGPSLR